MWSGRGLVSQGVTHTDIRYVGLEDRGCNMKFRTKVREALDSSLTGG